MAVLVLIETTRDKKVRKDALEALTYAHAMGAPPTAVALGEVDPDALKELARYGAGKVIHVSDAALNGGTVEAHVAVLQEVWESESPETVVLAHTLLGTQVAARLAARTGAAFAANVVSLPDTANGFVVKQSIYTGKAFMFTELKGAQKILAIRRNTLPLKEVNEEAEIVPYESPLASADLRVKVNAVEKTAGAVPLPEADIVVSGGRGMEGPEKWGILEDLAASLGGVMACSKPVSDAGWRPHHEHVGQTGIKVAPQLYIAVGISGAIQHLAGVNSSRCIVVINKDPEAPFFKAADYGVEGDAFEVVPRLTAAIKAERGS